MPIPPDLPRTTSSRANPTPLARSRRRRRIEVERQLGFRALIVAFSSHFERFEYGTKTSVRKGWSYFAEARSGVQTG